MDADAGKQWISKLLGVPTEYWGRCGVVAMIAFVVGIVIGGLGGYLIGNAGSSSGQVSGIVDPNVVIGEVKNVEIEESDAEGCVGIWVDVEGAVKLPGVYCMADEGIVKDAIESAGGFSENACVEWIAQNVNSAGLLEPNSMIYIPAHGEAVCGGLADEVGETVAAGSALGCDGVNINTATASELESLSGVGPSTAQKIIDGRPYSKVEDLLDVSGIGDATLEKFEAEVCL